MSGISRQVLWNLHTRWLTFPTFEEFRDVEYLRRSGAVNMMGYIERPLFDRGLFHGVNWVTRCKSEGVSWRDHYGDALEAFIKTHGSPGTWYDSEFKARVRKELRDAKIREMDAEMAKLDHDDMP